MPSKKRYSINHIHDGFKLGSYKHHKSDIQHDIQGVSEPTKVPEKIDDSARDNFAPSSSSLASSSSQICTAKYNTSKSERTEETVTEDLDKKQDHFAPDTCHSIKKPISNLLVAPDILNDTLQLSSLLIDARKSMIKDFANPNYNSLDHSIKTHNIHELKTGGGRFSATRQTTTSSITDNSNPSPVLNVASVSELKKYPNIDDNCNTTITSSPNHNLSPESPSYNEKLGRTAYVQPSEYYLDQEILAINPVTHLPYNSSKLIIPSMATLNRVEKVKAVVGSYYWYLNRYVAHNNNNPGELVWDPLEFIRNREGSSHNSSGNNNNHVSNGYAKAGHNKEILHNAISEMNDISSKTTVKKNHDNHHRHHNYNHSFVWKFTVDDIIASYHIYLNKMNSVNVPRRPNTTIALKQQDSLINPSISKNEIQNYNTNLDVTHDIKNQKTDINRIQKEPISNSTDSTNANNSKSSSNIADLQQKNLGSVTPDKICTDESLTPIRPFVSALAPTTGSSNLSLTKNSESLPDIDINQISFVSKHIKSTPSSSLPHHHLHIHHENHNMDTEKISRSLVITEEAQDNANSTPKSDKHRYRLLKSIPHHYRQKSSKSSISLSPSNPNHQRQSPSLNQKSKGGYVGNNEATNNKKNSIIDSSLENIVAANGATNDVPADTFSNLLPAFSNVQKKDATASYDFKLSNTGKKLYVSDNTVNASSENKLTSGGSNIVNGIETNTNNSCNDMHDVLMNEEMQDTFDGEYNSHGLTKASNHKEFESFDDLKNTIAHKSFKLPSFHSKGYLNSTPTSALKNSYQYTGTRLAPDQSLNVNTKGSFLNNSTPILNSGIQKPIIAITDASPSQSASHLFDNISVDKNSNGISGANLNTSNFEGNDGFLSPNIKFTKIRTNSSLGLRKVSDNINSSSSSSTGSSYLTPSNLQHENLNFEENKNPTKKKSNVKNGRSYQKRKQDARYKKKTISAELENECLLSGIYNAIQVGSTHLSVIDNHLDVVKFKYDSIFEFSKNVKFTVNTDNDGGDENSIEMENNLETMEVCSKLDKRNKSSMIVTALKQNEYLVSFISSLLPIYLDIYAKANENLSILKVRLNSTQQSLKIEKLLSMSDRLILNLNTKVALNYKQISDKHKLILQNSNDASNIWKCFIFKIAEYSIIIGLYILWAVLSIIRIVWRVVLGECFSK